MSEMSTLSLMGILASCIGMEMACLQATVEGVPSAVVMNGWAQAVAKVELGQMVDTMLHELIGDEENRSSDDGD